MAYSKAQGEATKRYLQKKREQEPELMRYRDYRSKAKTFIKKYADKDDLFELIEHAKNRIEELKAQ